MPDRARESVVPAFQVLVNGNQLQPEAEADLFLVEVADELDVPGMFTLSLNAGDPRSGGLKWVDDTLFREGNEVTIKMGFSAPLTQLLVGEIVALEPEFPERGPIVFTVRGYDRLHRLAIGRKSRAFRNMTDSEIAAQIAQDYSLTPESDDSAVKHDHVYQHNQTDLEFLRLRAARMGWEVKVDGKKLLFRKPKPATGKILTLTYGDNLVSVAPRLTLATQTSEVRVQGWSPKDKKVITARAGGGDETTTMGGRDSGPTLAQRVVGPSTLMIVSEPPATPEDAEAMARGRLEQVALDFVIAEGSCVGEPQIRPGVVLELRSLGSRLSGLYYVVGATHSLAARKGYLTSFTARRNAA